MTSFLKDIAEKRKKQLIITTHNPQMVKHAELENIHLITRKDCFSIISNPSKSNDVKKFLENEMGVDQLFIHNLLE